MAKTNFIDGDASQNILGTLVTAAFLNKLNNQRHTGRDIDGEGALDYAVATGSANAYAITLTPVLDSYIPGMPMIFKANHENTGAATLNVDSLGALTLKKHGSRALSAGDIKSGQIVICIYDGTNLQIISEIADEAIGAEIMWPTETPPEGWLEEDGSSLVRATYQALYNLIGTMYGADDSTHFNLPDMRGKFPRIWDHAAAVDPDRASRTAPTKTGATITAGDHVGTNQVDAFKNHVHQEGGSPSGSQNARVVYGMGAQTGDDALNSSTLATGGNETRPINTNRMMIIKAY